MMRWRMIGLSTLGIILLIVLILLLLGAPIGFYPSGWGYWPGGIVGLLLLVVIILLVLGRI
jgi:hypothetical protein